MQNPTKRRRHPHSVKGYRGWKLEDAKARFSEVVRRAQSESPQRVTVPEPLSCSLSPTFRQSLPPNTTSTAGFRVIPTEPRSSSWPRIVSSQRAQ